MSRSGEFCLRMKRRLTFAAGIRRYSTLNFSVGSMVGPEMWSVIRIRMV